MTPTPARPGEFRPLQLGPLSIWPPVVLAPMAGVTNAAFRTICREFGAGLYVSEMITARGLLEGNSMTRLLASAAAGERPRSIQLYGSDPTEVGAAAAALVADGVEHIDLNFGCPVAKITRHGGGCAIPVKPRLMAAIVRAAVRAAGPVPVTVKVRLGIDETVLTFHDAGAVAEAEGAAAIGLHARTAAQLYAGEADWTAIAALKAAVGIPVLGNGDVWECWDALRMMRETGCDGVIVGRGCLGRPWLFAELATVFDGREPGPPPHLGTIMTLMRRHAELLAALFGERAAMRQMRKWCVWYLTGFRGSSYVRRQLPALHTIADLDAVLSGLDPTQPFPPSVLRTIRGKSGQRQEVVRLPAGYLDARDDDRPPAPLDAEWERGLDGG